RRGIARVRRSAPAHERLLRRRGRQRRCPKASARHRRGALLPRQLQSGTAVPLRRGGAGWRQSALDPRGLRSGRLESPHMDLTALLRSHFDEGIELRRRMAETLPAQLARAGEALASALKSGKKALACGNGGSAADSQHFAAELVGRFERERPGLPAIALTTD